MSAGIRLAVVTVLSMVALPRPGQAQETTKVALIREVMTLTRVAETVVQTMEGGVEAQRRASPDIPEVFWERFLQRARERMPEFIERMIPAYSDAFSEEDLRALIAFYRTPAGTRFLAAQPELIRASMAAGEQWGVELGTQVVDELQKEGVKLD